MNKSLVILGSLIVVFMFSGVGFSKGPQRKVAQDKKTETVLGPVIMVERQINLDVESCGAHFEKRYSIGSDDQYVSYQCDVPVFEKSDEEEKISSSLNNIPYDQRKALIKDVCNNHFEASLMMTPNGFQIDTSSSSVKQCPDADKVTKEEFLKAAKTLIARFPSATVKSIKVKR